MKTLYTIVWIYSNPYYEGKEEEEYHLKKSSYSKQKLLDEFTDWINRNPEKKIQDCIIGHEVKFKREISIEVKEKV